MAQHCAAQCPSKPVSINSSMVQHTAHHSAGPQGEALPGPDSALRHSMTQHAHSATQHWCGRLTFSSHRVQQQQQQGSCMLRLGLARQCVLLACGPAHAAVM
jgi:hypothetical protein